MLKLMLCIFADFNKKRKLKLDQYIENTRLKEKQKEEQLKNQENPNEEMKKDEKTEQQNLEEMHKKEILRKLLNERVLARKKCTQAFKSISRDKWENLNNKGCDSPPVGKYRPRYLYNTFENKEILQKRNSDSVYKKSKNNASKTVKLIAKSFTNRNSDLLRLKESSKLSNYKNPNEKLKKIFVEYGKKSENVENSLIFPEITSIMRQKRVEIKNRLNKSLLINNNIP